MCAGFQHLQYSSTLRYSCQKAYRFQVRVCVVQEVESLEGKDLVKEAMAGVRVVQRKLEDLERLVGRSRRALIMGRLSNTGSSKEGAVYANRVDYYTNKVCTLTKLSLMMCSRLQCVCQRGFHHAEKNL